MIPQTPILRLLSNSGNHFIHPDVLQEIKKLYPMVEPITSTSKVKKTKPATKPRFKSLKILTCTKTTNLNYTVSEDIQLPNYKKLRKPMIYQSTIYVY